jgi:AraC-type DNA-binding domain-containing proteins
MMPFLLAEIANLDPILPLYVHCVGSHEQKELHRTNGFPAHQLFLTRAGSGTFQIDGRPPVRMTPGSVMLLPANVPHTYRPDRSGEIWDLGFVAFQGSASESLLEHLKVIGMTARETPSFEKLWNQLEALWSLISLNGEQAYWEASKRMYDMLLTLLEGQVRDKKTAAKGVYPSAQPNPSMQTAVKLMHDHYNERLLLANVARASGYSIQHFHRLFVSHYGVTPQRYILGLRMKRARQLMDEQPGISVEKVAEAMGMDTTYFIRMFKRTYGITPGKYLTKV